MKMPAMERWCGIWPRGANGMLLHLQRTHNHRFTIMIPEIVAPTLYSWQGYMYFINGNTACNVFIRLLLRITVLFGK
jgi:hypothetical protein